MLVCAGDMPFVPVALLASLGRGRPRGPHGAAGRGGRRVAGPRGPRAALGRAGRRCRVGNGALQPLLGVFTGRRAWSRWPRRRGEAVAPARAVVAALGPLVVPVTDPRALFNVNSAEDLREAEALLASG